MAGLEDADKARTMYMNNFLDVKAEIEHKFDTIIVPMYEETMTPLLDHYAKRSQVLMEEMRPEVEMVDNHILSRFRRAMGVSPYEKHWMKKLSREFGIKVKVYDLENGEISVIVGKQTLAKLPVGIINFVRGV